MALPGLSRSRVHLFAADGLTGHGRQDLDDSEADLVVRRVPVAQAVEAVKAGGMLRCAASAQLVLMLAQAPRRLGS